MNKTAIGLLFIVIITISVLSYLLLSKCPAGKERKGFKCVDKVSSTTTSRSGLVGSSGAVNCPVGQVSDVNGNCVIPRQIIPPITPAQIAAGQKAGVTSYTQCPLSHPLKEYRSCVNVCAPGLFIDISECVQSCPSNKVLHNGRCLTSCPAGMFVDLSNGVIPICRSSCPTNRPRIDIDISRCQPCSTRIPSQVNNGGQCLAMCPAGTYRNDISMCVPINPLSSVTRTQVSGGWNTQESWRLVDGNWSSLYNPTSTSPTWVYFQNISRQGQMLYGFTIKFGNGSTNNINLKMYNNNTSLTDANKIFDETISNVGPEVTIRRNFNPPVALTNLYLLFSKNVWIHEFEVTVR